MSLIELEELNHCFPSILPCIWHEFIICEEAIIRFATFNVLIFRVLLYN